jgi:WD40 repeat protein
LLTNAFKVVQLWDVATGRPLRSPMTHRNPVLQASFSPDGRYILTAGRDGTARLWDTAKGEQRGTSLKHAGPLSRAAFSPDGNRVLTAGRDGTTRVWDYAALTDRSRPPHQWTYKRQELSRLYSADGRRVVTHAPEGKIQVIDPETGQPIGPPLEDVLTSKSGSQFISPDGRWVVTSSFDGGPAQVWDVVTGRPHTSPLTHAPEGASFSPDSSRLLTPLLPLRRVVTSQSPERNEARLWDVATGQPIGQPLAHQDRLLGASFSPDGRRVVTASEDRTARVWDAATGQPITPPLEHGGSITFAAFSPDGSRVISVAEDLLARQWDATTGQTAGPLLHLPQHTWSACCSPDGRRIVTLGAFELQVWDATTGDPVAPPFTHNKVRSVAFTADGRHVLGVSDESKAAWEWDYSPDDRPVADLVLLAELLTGHQLDRAAAIAPLDREKWQKAWTDLRARYPQGFTNPDRGSGKTRREAEETLGRRK